MCGAFLMITAALGCVAAQTKSEFLSFIFGFCTMNIMLIFIALGIAAVILKNTISSTIDAECNTQSGMIYEMD